MSTTELPSDTATAGKSEPVPGSDEYNALVLERGKGAIEVEEPKEINETLPSETPEVPQRPDHIPEKFWDAEKGEVLLEALLKSNSDLEKELTQSRQKASEQPKETPEDPPKGTEEVIPENLEVFFDEYDQAGQLSDASYEKLAKLGIPPAVVNAYIEGQNAIIAKNTEMGHSLVGGQENYDKIAAWAVNNLTPAQLQEYNRAVNTSPESMEIAVLGLKTKYEAANGKVPTFISGATAAPSGGVGYQSQAEMIRDMSDPRYDSDPAYRSVVEAKLARTTKF
jgi:hypothetical protein